MEPKIEKNDKEQNGGELEAGWAPLGNKDYQPADYHPPFDPFKVPLRYR